MRDGNYDCGNVDCGRGYCADHRQHNINGPLVSVDGGTSFTGSQTFTWTPGSNHTLATTSPQSGGTGIQYVWLNWSDAGAISHSVAPTTATTYTASFKTQYLLTTQVSPSASEGSISPSTGLVDAGSTVSVTATPNTGYVFTGFSGGLSGTTNPQNLMVNAATTVTANFAPGPTSLGGSIGLKSGPPNARVWPFSIGNNGPGVALSAEIVNLTFAQTSGAACATAPTITSAMPAVAGDIGVHATATANVTIDFSGCPSNAFFKVTANLSANGGAATGSIVKLNQLP
jgi:Divergent InlB B-repeat domain